MDYLHIGLSSSKAKDILLTTGPNTIPAKVTNTWISILLSQFKSPLIYILLIVGCLSLLYGELLDFILIMSVVLLNVAMGFGQEYGAHRTFESLKNLVTPNTLVIRDGRRMYIERSTIVPGDLVVLGSGDKIPADGKLLEGVDLLVKESILTGESEAIQKDFHASAQLYMGTDVVSGEGIMEVTRTGKSTELGKIGLHLTQSPDQKTPLQKSLEQLSKKIGLIIVIVCFIIFLVGIAAGKNPLEMLRLSVILSVAGIPEGLPISITIILSIAAKQILKRKGLVKQLISVETLGSTTVLCLDKTGTLTEGVMKIVKTDYKNPERIVISTLLANEQRTDLEVSVWKHFNEKYPALFSTLRKDVVRQKKIPFTSERKYSISIGTVGHQTRTYLIGAPDILIHFCKTTPEQRASIEEHLHHWTSRGHRLIAFASKKGVLQGTNLSGFEWDGLITIEDPLRTEVAETLEKASEAGMSVKIITGDHRDTAVKILENLGLNLTEKTILTGDMLSHMDRTEILERIENTTLFARVTPQHKLLIVELLQEQGHVVAMTGDGVNDAQALKRADIGVVMGNSSDLAKDAGDLILLNNDFRVILKAVEQGRLIYENMKKSVAYVLSNSFVEIILIVGALLVGLPTPLSVAQILWLHLICDGPPDIMLGFEPKEEDLMKIKVTKLSIQNKSLLNNMGILILVCISSLVGIASLFIFISTYKSMNDLSFARSVTFIAVGMVDLIYVFSFKSLRYPILDPKVLFNNKFMLVSIFYGFVLLSAALFIEPLRITLGLAKISPLFLLVGFLLGLISIAWMEILKYSFRRRELRRVQTLV